MSPPRRQAPEQSIAHLQDELSRAARDLFGQTHGAQRLAEFVPRIDISETKDAIIVRADLPGMEAKDIEVTIEGQYLSLRGEKRSMKEEKGQSFLRTERSFGSFQRVIALPAEVNPKSAKAIRKDGVLELVLPKTRTT